MLLFFTFTLNLLSYFARSQAENCYLLDQNLKQICYACQEKYFSLKESPMFGVPFNIGECSAKSNATKEIEIFVSDKKCLNGSSCDGTRLNPMDDLLVALEKLNSESLKYLHANITLYLLGDNHYILEKDLRVSSKYYFRRRLMSIKILPYLCTLGELVGCKKDTDLITINLKTNQIFIFISGILYLKNVMFNGADMVVENRTSNACYSNKSACCGYILAACSTAYTVKQQPDITNSSWGFINTEKLEMSENFIGYPFPIISIENCRFYKIVTVFPTQSARFGGIVKSLDMAINISFSNVTILDCTLFNGILYIQNQRPGLWVKNRASIISLSKISIGLYDNFVIKLFTKNIFVFNNYFGRFSIDILNFTFFSNQNKGNPFLFVFDNDNSEVLLGKLLLGTCNYFGFLKYRGIGIFEISDITYRQINSSLISFFDYSGLALKIGSLIMDSCIFNSSTNLFMNIINVFLPAEINTILIKSSQNISFYFKGITAKIGNATFINFISSTCLMELYNSSMTFENLTLNETEVRYHTLILLNSYHINFKISLILLNGVFKFVKFKSAKKYICFFSWPISNLGDKLLMNNIYIQNVNNEKPDVIDLVTVSFLYFFRTYFCDYGEFTNFTITYLFSTRFTLVNFYDFGRLMVQNGLFVQIRSSKQHFFKLDGGTLKNILLFSNISFVNVSLSYPVFYIGGLSIANFTSFSFINVGFIDCEICSFSFIMNRITYLKNITLRSLINFDNESVYFIQFFDFLHLELLFIYNASFINLVENPLFRSAQLIFAEKCLLSRLYNIYSINFYCNRNIKTSFGNDIGLFSFVHLENYVAFGKLNTATELINVTIENCKYCKFGVLGVQYIDFVYMTNITINTSLTLKGGALSVIAGIKVSLLNFNSFENKAANEGGYLYIKDCDNVSLLNSFSFNTDAEIGGALYLKNVKNFTALNHKCFNAYSSQYGGFVSAKDTFITMIRGYIYKAISEGDGGGFLIEKGALRALDHLLIEECRCLSGGLIYGRILDFIQFVNVTVKNVTTFDKGITLYLDDIKGIDIRGISFFDIISEGYSNFYIILRKQAEKYFIANVYALRVDILQLNFLFLINLLQEVRSFSFTLVNGVFLEFEGIFMIVEFQKISFTQNFTLQNVTLKGKIGDNSNKPGHLLTFSNVFLIFIEVNLLNAKFSESGFYLQETNSYMESVNFMSNSVWDPIEKDCSLFDILDSDVVLIDILFEGKAFQNLGLSLAFSSNITMVSINLHNCHKTWDSCIKAFKSKLIINGSKFYGNFGLNAGVINCLNTSLNLDNNTFLSNLFMSLPMINNFFFQKLSNNIIISGYYIGYEESILSNNLFIDTSKGTVICIENTKVSILFSKFTTNFSKNPSTIQENKAIAGINSDISIIFCDFSNFSSKFGGTISLERTSSRIGDIYLLMKYSRINNSVSNYGGAFVLIGYDILYLEGNTFINCRALKNEIGKLGSFGVGFSVGLKGSCLQNKGFFKLFGNKFLNNKAEMFIANIFSCTKILTDDSGTTSDSNSMVDSNIYTYNEDAYINLTDTIFFFPLKIRLFIRDKTNKKYLVLSEAKDNQTIEITSGNPIDLKVILTDYLGNTLIFDDDSVADIEEYSEEDKFELFIISNKKAFSKAGVFFFEGLTINVDPTKGFKIKLNINLKFEKVFSAELFNFGIKTFLIELFSRACVVGELFIVGDQSCMKCPKGKYSLIEPMKTLNDFQRCYQCPENAYCPGGALIIPMRGYWRSTNTSIFITECLSKYSCLGVYDGVLQGDEIFHGKCLEFNKGPFCYLCENGYARFSRKDICKPCSSEIWVYVKFFLLLISIVGYFIIQIKISFKIGRASHIGILLKMMVTHIQQISLISLADLGWTPDFRNFLLIEEYFSFLFDDFLPIECFLYNFGYNKYSQKIIASNMLPIVVSILVFIIWIVLLFIFKNIESKRCLTIAECFETLKMTSLIVIVLLFPEIIKKCLNLFNCIDLNDSNKTRVLLYSPDVVCWEAEHLKYIKYCALPGLIIWGVMAPLYIAYHLRENRYAIKELIRKRKNVKILDINNDHNLQIHHNPRLAFSIPKNQISKNPSSIENKRIRSILKISNVKKESKTEISEDPVNFTSYEAKLNNLNIKQKRAFMLKFLYKGYSEKYYYWEEFMFLKKFTLISISSVSDLFPSSLRGMVLIILFSFFLIIHSRLKPYETSYLNKAELFSLLTTFLIAIIGIMMFTADLRRIALVLFILVIVINSMFFIYWLYLFLREFSREFSIIRKIILFFYLKKSVTVQSELSTSKSVQSKTPQVTRQLKFDQTISKLE